MVLISFEKKHIKCNLKPNELLNDLVSIACEKFSLDFSDSNYDLIPQSNLTTGRKQGKPLDLSLPFRFSGLTSNSKLELLVRPKIGGLSHVPVAHGNKDITLTIQYNVDKFPVSLPIHCTLWDLLKRIERLYTFKLQEDHGLHYSHEQPPTEDNTITRVLLNHSNTYLHPTLHYVSKEFTTFEQLSKMTLEKLGLRSSLSSGSVLFRLKFINCSDGEQILSRILKQESRMMDFIPIGIEKEHEHMMQLKEETMDSPPMKLKEEIMDSPPMKLKEEIMDSNKSETMEVLPKKLEEEIMDSNISETMGIARNERVFFSHTTVINPESISLPPEFYDLDTADYATLMETNGKKKALEVQMKSQLMTREMRTKFLRKNSSRITHTSLLVKFPDHFELQGTFLPDEPLLSVFAFVRSHLIHSLSTTPFSLQSRYPVHLYTLDSSDSRKSLETLHMVPSETLYFSLSNTTNLSDTTPPVSFLNPDLCKLAEKRQVQNYNQELFPFPPSMNISPSSPLPRPKQIQSKITSSAPKKSKKTPKWLKL